MSRRILEKNQNRAKKLQREVDVHVRRRGQLLDAASRAENFKAKADCWKSVHAIELHIERLNRKIRRLQTPQNVPDPEPLLWDFAQADAGKPSKRKGGK